MAEDSFVNQIRRVCDLAKSYNLHQGAIRSSSLDGVQMVNRLRKAARLLSEKLCFSQESAYQVSYSKGQSNIPKILWLAIHPKGRKVSNHMSVVICFGKNGEGVVAGVMEPVLGMVGNLKPTVRSNKNCLIDVDGGKPGMRYNDKFMNPKEFTFAGLTADSLVSHVESSISLLRNLTEQKKTSFSTSD